MCSRISLILALLCLPCSAAYYTTTFKYQDNQRPIYEGGNWVNGKSGINWSNVQTYSGYATADRGHNTSDSGALLTGTWGPDQDVTAKIFIGAIAPSHGPEIACLLRGTISGSGGGSFRVYEVFVSLDGSEDNWIVRWNGPAGDFTGLAHSFHTVANGDTIRATIVGQTITLYINGVSVLSTTDNSASKITSGNPGMSFDADDGSFDFSTFGITSYTATDGQGETHVNHTAVSCDLSNVQASLNWCLDTDTNTIPAGNADWNLGSLLMTQQIALVGAGTNSTFITNNVGGGAYALHGIWTSANTTGLITGITFSGGNSAQQCIYIEGANTNASRTRIYNNKWWNAPGALKLDTVLGCFDHNYVFGNAPGNKVAHIKDSNWDGSSVGNGVWANATPLMGNEQSFFFEDNTITSTNTVFVMSMIDAQAGGRYVFRHNIVTNAYFEGHGSVAQYERSTHAVEAYMNSFYQQNVNQIVCYARGGVWYYWSNKVYDVTSANCLKLLSERPNDSLFQPFGGADGRNHWDVNNAGNPFATGTAASAGNLTVTVSGSPWSVNQWVGYVVRRTSGKSISSLTCAAGSPPIITAVCANHGFSTGDKVSIYGADQQEYNSLWTITVTASDHFTAQTVGAVPTSPATGTILCCLGNYFSEINANTIDTLTFNPSAFGAPVTMVFAANDTFEINKIDRLMDAIGRTGGSLIDSTPTPSFPGAWNNQTTSACYQWSNSAGNVAITFGPSSATIIQNTDYVDNNFPGTYSSYPYPHYLVGPGGVVEWGAVPNLGMHGGNQGKIAAKGAITIQ